MKKFLVLMLAAVMLFAFAGCAGSDAFEPDLSDLPTIEGADFEELIDDFAEDPFNVVELKSGEKEKPTKADYTLFRGGKCYSSDESVATVSDSGTIKAVGRGTCYIALVGDESIHGREIMVYKVVVDSTITLKLSQALQGDGEAIVFLIPVLFVLFGVGVVAVIVVIVLKVMNNARTSAPKYDAPTKKKSTGFVVSSMENQQSDFGGVNHVNPGKCCPQCGKQVEGAFCPYCGAKMQ